MYEELLGKMLSKERFTHCRNVATKAAELAKRLGADEEKAYLAGLLHDICKEQDAEKQLKLIENGGIILSCSQLRCPKVWHAYASAFYVRDVLGIKDGDVFDAIYYHTTGKENMPLLTKIVFISDLISQERTYPEVGYLRSLSDDDFDMAVVESLRLSIEFIENKGGYVLNDTVKAYEFYKEKQK